MLLDAHLVYERSKWGNEALSLRNVSDSNCSSQLLGDYVQSNWCVMKTSGALLRVCLKRQKNDARIARLCSVVHINV